MFRFRTNLFLGTMWPKLLMWMCHMSFNYALNPHFMIVPHVNIVSVPRVTKPLAKCSIYIVAT
jgi:hypothetical protein